jgi:hypothetical protein
MRAHLIPVQLASTCLAAYWIADRIVDACTQTHAGIDIIDAASQYFLPSQA